MPCGIGDRRRVRVDQQFGARRGFVFFRSVASQMDLADPLRRKAIDIVVRVITHVVRTDDNVADVTQKLASGADRNLSEKLGLCNRGGAKSDVTCRVLDQIRPDNTSWT